MEAWIEQMKKGWFTQLAPSCRPTAAFRMAPTINNWEPNPQFLKEKKNLSFVIINSAQHSFLPSSELLNTIQPHAAPLLHHFLSWLLSTLEATLSVWRLKYKPSPHESLFSQSIMRLTSAAGTAEIQRSCPLTAETRFVQETKTR